MPLIFDVCSKKTQKDVLKWKWFCFGSLVSHLWFVDFIFLKLIAANFVGVIVGWMVLSLPIRPHPLPGDPLRVGIFRRLTNFNHLLPLLFLRTTFSPKIHSQQRLVAKCLWRNKPFLLPLNAPLLLYGPRNVTLTTNNFVCSKKQRQRFRSFSLEFKVKWFSVFRWGNRFFSKPF